MRTHLVYKLELPSKDKENRPQESLNIERLQNKMKARIPTHLQGQFGQEKFVPADPPDMLNYEGCELLLISASDGIGEGWEWSSRQNVKAMMIQLLVLIW
ncbi:hypothetical protein DKX38_020368 [Salix brachista]|uniref:Uncharacterized protein n=1 Tax=Salix brachista TaxID=2182728 RepID=A0A5N5K564_9ROSI|nr:hypothetical protein DKX38_020368 [Salix brachista]